MANLDGLNEARVETALIFLSQTDEQDARLSGRVKELEEGLKSVKSMEYLKAQGADGVRKATAESSPAYQQAVGVWASVWTEWKTLNNQRAQEMRVIDIWRTLESSRRQGRV